MVLWDQLYPMGRLVRKFQSYLLVPLVLWVLPNQLFPLVLLAPLVLFHRLARLDLLVLNVQLVQLVRMCR